MTTLNPPANPSTVPYVAPWKRPKAPLRIEPNLADELGDLPEWHEAAPPAVLLARTELDETTETLRKATYAVEDVEADAQAEEQANHAAIVGAAAHGLQRPELVKSDWEAERIGRAVWWGTCATKARNARRAYDKAVRDALPAWAAEMAGSLAAKRTTARKAGRKAIAEVSELVESVALAKALDADLGPDGQGGPAWHRTTPEEARKVSRVRQALADLSAYLDSEDPVVTGSYLTEPATMTPPLHTRKALASMQRESAWHWLATLEREEAYRVTELTDREAAAGIATRLEGWRGIVSSDVRRRTITLDPGQDG